MQIPSLQFLASAYQTNQLLEIRGRFVLFLGRSNVGKSSLINALWKKTIAHTSKQPGKTRSVNYFETANHITVVDFPGYGYAKRAQTERANWQLLIQSFFDTLKHTGKAFLLCDSKRDLEDEEMMLLNTLIEKGYSLSLVVTKADRLNQSERLKREKYFTQASFAYGPFNFFFVSSRTGEGLEQLRRDMR